MQPETRAIVSVRRGPPGDWPKEPYKGLNYFTAADAPLFTQRDEEVEDCAALMELFNSRALLLHGLSGTGKSSFLRAGLIPRLENPPEEACRFFFLNDERGQAFLVRATDDPIGRIHNRLAQAISVDRRVPQTARDKVQQILAAPPNLDRKLAAETLIDALVALTAGLSYPLVLVIDQAEEVLTLPHPAQGVCNRRVAFFYLIEEICYRRLDMRSVVSFRTEYYGQFCSFFRISPTTRITSRAEPRAGLVDYLLRNLDDPERIAAAIRRPTLGVRPDHPFNRLEPPFKRYNFEYAPGVPEQMAQDLVRHSRDASTLPVMQIVCRDLYLRVCKRNRPVIRMADYEAIGGVEGALEAHIETAIRGALSAAGQNPVSSDAVNRWRMALTCLVGRQEGGAVTTLIASEDQLIAAARAEGITGDVRRALQAMAEERWWMLRPVRQPAANQSAYSLGHDCLGPPLSSWREKHGARVAANKRVRRLRIIFCLVLMAAALSSSFTIGLVAYLAQRRALTVLSTVATEQPSSNLRLRLLLLTASLNKSQAWPWSWFIGPEQARNNLRDALLRAPVFGGAFPAALDAEGDRIARVEGDKVIIRDLRAENPDSADIWTTSDPQLAPPAPDSQRPQRSPVVGFVGIQQNGGTAGQVLVINRALPTDLMVFAPNAREPASIKLSLPPKFISGAPRPSQPDMAGGSLRFLLLNFGQGLIDQMSVLPVRVSPGPVFEPLERPNYRLDWEPAKSNSWRVPVLADDCDSYALLGRQQQEASPEPNLPVVSIGRLEGPAEPLLLQHDPIEQGNHLFSSVTFARGCVATIVRSKWGHGETGKLFVVGLEKHALPAQPSIRSFIIPEPLGSFLPTSVPQFQSPLAAAPRSKGQALRVAWVVENGLAIVDAEQGQSSAQPLFGTAKKPSTLLTGSDTTATVSRLTISRDGDFLLFSQQRNFGAIPEVRVFDLRREKRRKTLENIDLQQEACRVAALLPSGNKLNKSERIAWLGGSQATQPCPD